MASFAGLRLVLRVACPSVSLSSVAAVTLACRALRRVGFCASAIESMSRLALRIPLARDARPTRGVFTLDWGCGVGVLRRLADRALLRSAMVSSIDAWRAMFVHVV
jgi:hypothetical protein